MKPRKLISPIILGICSLQFLSPVSAQDSDSERTEEEKEIIRRFMKRKEVKPLALDEYLLRENLYETSIEDMLKSGKKLGFEYMSRQKNSLRSAYPKLTLFGEDVGEVIIRSEDGKISGITVAIFNRGDDGTMASASFQQKYDKFEAALTEKTSERPRNKNRSGVTDVKGRLWVTESQAYLLESALSKEENPEFMRLLGTSAKSSRTQSRMTNRSALKHNVAEKDNGDVYIEGVPMVDQGQKGYCAVASAQRIFNYYGNGIDMHELAQAAETGPNSGTTLPEMVDSLKKGMSLVRSRVLITWTKYDGIDEKEYDERANVRYMKDLSRICKKYNRARKKRGFSDLMIPLRDFGGIDLPIRDISLDAVDLELWREINMDTNDYRTFISRIKKYIDQGIPVAWALQLGMFKEEGLPQSGGGHMRLIIGYNEKTNEIIYSDSWGKGHDYKKMHAGNAFCMTTATMTFIPNR